MKTAKTALVRAVDLLSRQSHSLKKLHDKLRSKGYSEAETVAALQVLLQRGYLDDATLCQRVYQQQLDAGKSSLKQIFYKLLNKGFSAELIKSCQRVDDIVLEQQTALTVLQGHYRSSQQVEPIRMMQYLYGKGFRQASIRAAVQAFTAQDCPDFDEF